MAQALQVTDQNLPSVQDGLQKYLQRVSQIPLLTEAEERSLALRFHEQGDLEAAQQLVISNLRFVASIARGYMGYGLAFGDLVQEGTIGLMKAVKRFDPNMGVRLVAFAVHWIKAEMHEYIIRNWRIVKVATTKAQRKLFFNLRGKKNKLATWFTQEEVDSVAKDLGVSAKDVVEMEARLSMHDAAYDMPSAESDQGETYTVAPAQYLTAPNADPFDVVSQNNEDGYQQDELQSALSKLDARSLDILKERYLKDKKTSLKVLAQKYQVSLERIRQIEKAAIKTLKDEIEHCA